ncbi:hypothetical protein TSOC_003698 [Tetrabaena socialis]|uniref:Uncharacterized protein n=1 Tax=Tetrabaena socialis TaxID=47790 RepID=A0A2J8AAZ1_9CHLO|nr:hypothetical protein TSOC_003698 [Tetrabaena socialis]|eukprot:PNH09685.1 hypothetical protein TSOC_003698 [Tetrabaena socialis]
MAAQPSNGTTRQHAKALVSCFAAPGSTSGLGPMLRASPALLVVAPASVQRPQTAASAAPAATAATLWSYRVMGDLTTFGSTRAAASWEAYPRPQDPRPQSGGAAPSGVALRWNTAQ